MLNIMIENVNKNMNN